MQAITVQEQYEWFIKALRDIGTHLLDLSDDLIGDYVFEEFDGDCTSFLSTAVLQPLYEKQFITREIYEKSLELARRFRALEHTSLWDVAAVKTAPEWREVLTLADEIKEMLNLPADYLLNEEYRYLNAIALEIDSTAKFQVRIKTWNEYIRLESDGYVFFCKDGEKICCEEEPILYRVRDWIAYLKFILTAEPVPKEKRDQIGKCDYENVLADILSDEDYRYCFMSAPDRNVYLYPKDADHYCIEITEGDPRLEPPTPFRVLYRTEVNTARLTEWIEILQPYAPY